MGYMDNQQFYNQPPAFQGSQMGMAGGMQQVAGQQAGNYAGMQPQGDQIPPQMMQQYQNLMGGQNGFQGYYGGMGPQVPGVPMHGQPLQSPIQAQPPGGFQPIPRGPQIPGHQLNGPPMARPQQPMPQPQRIGAGQYRMPNGQIVNSAQQPAMPMQRAPVARQVPVPATPQALLSQPPVRRR